MCTSSLPPVSTTASPELPLQAALGNFLSPWATYLHPGKQAGGWAGLGVLGVYAFFVATHSPDSHFPNPLQGTVPSPPIQG